MCTGSPSSKYEHRRTSAFVWQKKLSFLNSVTYENERISIKNSLPYLKFVLRLSCVVHGPIYGHFLGFYVNGFLILKSGHKPINKMDLQREIRIALTKKKTTT